MENSFLYITRIYVSAYLNKGSFRQMQYSDDGWNFEFKKFNFSNRFVDVHSFDVALFSKKNTLVQI